MFPNNLFGLLGFGQQAGFTPMPQSPFPQGFPGTFGQPGNPQIFPEQFAAQFRPQSLDQGPAAPDAPEGTVEFDQAGEITKQIEQIQNILKQRETLNNQMTGNPQVPQISPQIGNRSGEPIGLLNTQTPKAGAINGFIRTPLRGLL